MLLDKDPSLRDRGTEFSSSSQYISLHVTALEQGTMPGAALSPRGGRGGGDRNDPELSELDLELVPKLSVLFL